MQVSGAVSDPIRSAAELAQLAQLRAVDQKVRAHEQAHMAAAGRYAASGPSYQYVTGPDNQQYAVGSEVSIDASPVRGDPQATVQKMLTVIAAANAPVDPSPQDQQVAAQAAATLAVAQSEAIRRSYADAATAEEAASSILSSVVG